MTVTVGTLNAGRRRRGWLSWGVAALLACCGCAPTEKPAPEPPPAPPAWTRAYGPPRAASPAEYQNALAQYRALRGPTPEPLTVAPKAPPRNDYPEFDDDLYRMPSGRSLPRPDGGRPASGASGDDYADAGGAAGFAGGLKPIEQLVYGGEHPELDPPEKYRLQPRDSVRIDVRDHAELSGTVAVASDGTLRLPTAGDFVAVRGRTVDEATARVRETLVPYLKEPPEVRLVVEGARGGYYQIFGDVRHPGRYPMGTEPVRASDAILAANWEALPGRADAEAFRDELGPAFPAARPRGQFSPVPTADLRAVHIYTPHRSRPVRYVCDLEPALYRGATGDDPYIRSGQVIFVPSRDPGRNPEWARN